MKIGISRYLLLVLPILLFYSCNPENEQADDNGNNTNVGAPAESTILKLNFGGTWKTYNIPAPCLIDRGDCMGAWEEYLTFGLSDRVFFWLGDATFNDTTYHYSETNLFTQCEIPKVEVRTIGEALNDLEDFYGVPLYTIFSASGEGEFTVSNLSDEALSISWQGNLVILRTTLLDTAGVIPAQFIAVNNSYEDIR